MLQLLLDLGFDADERKRVVGGDEVYETRGLPLERAQNCAAEFEQVKSAFIKTVLPFIDQEKIGKIQLR